MKLNTKKVFAREILLIIFSSLLCVLAFWIGGFVDNVQDKKEEKLYSEMLVCEKQIDNYHNKFFKIQQVDSIMKIQMIFYSEYSKFLNNDTLDQGNYFFWKNVRKSINDSTFHFTYAKDEMINLIRNNNEINLILHENKRKRLNDETAYCFQNEIRNEFKLFALSNGYEKYISPYDWKTYQELREKKIELGIKKEKEERRNHNIDESFLEFAFLFCISVFFLLRYFYYLVKWCIKIINSKEV